jgi:hypothetical protein
MTGKARRRLIASTLSNPLAKAAIVFCWSPLIKLGG